MARVLSQLFSRNSVFTVIVVDRLCCSTHDIYAGVLENTVQRRYPKLFSTTLVSYPSDAVI